MIWYTVRLYYLVCSAISPIQHHVNSIPQLGRKHAHARPDPINHSHSQHLHSLVHAIRHIRVRALWHGNQGLGMRGI